MQKSSNHCVRNMKSSYRSPQQRACQQATHIVPHITCKRSVKSHLLSARVDRQRRLHLRVGRDEPHLRRVRVLAARFGHLATDAVGQVSGKSTFEVQHSFLYFFSLVRVFVRTFLVYLRTVNASPQKLARPLARGSISNLTLETYAIVSSHGVPLCLVYSNPVLPCKSPSPPPRVSQLRGISYPTPSPPPSEPIAWLRGISYPTPSPPPSPLPHGL